MIPRRTAVVGILALLAGCKDNADNKWWCSRRYSLAVDATGTLLIKVGGVFLKKGYNPHVKVAGVILMAAGHALKVIIRDSCGSAEITSPLSKEQLQVLKSKTSVDYTVIAERQSEGVGIIYTSKTEELVSGSLPIQKQ